MSHFRKILVWQKSITLVTKIYKATSTFPKEETFGLTSQIRRSSVSIPSNIAEGSGRESNKDFLRFLYISLGSIFEMQTQLEIAKNIIYIKEEEFNLLYEDSREIERMLASLIRKLKDPI
ncbi:four helix bundle protein [Flavobacterium sp. JLP]|uniref:four helix bundle protein n=1 Tax=unclassified Flavobacterium TaxID=196869 RepID=UPI00188DA725|nr:MULTISPECIES: four helix bundle protein [unclassified Flavobacterium]MBF4493457.1 four helix bundle protein [Flavobacterium sp. MR2016-29]MBF4507970.1 four helix bundle protein [Flavobacterium sp. JLP]